MRAALTLLVFTACVHAVPIPPDAPVLIVVEGDGSQCQPFSEKAWERFVDRRPGPYVLIKPVTFINRHCDRDDSWKARDFFSRVDELEIDVASIRDRFPGRKRVLLGHSAGAHVAMLLATRRPDLVDGLINLSGGIDSLRGVFEDLKRDPSELGGRNPTFWEQMLDSGVKELWRTYSRPCLVMHGTEDRYSVPFHGVLRDVREMTGSCSFVPMNGVGHDSLGLHTFEQAEFRAFLRRF